MNIAEALKKIAEALKVPSPTAPAAPAAPLKNPGESTQKLKGLPNPTALRAPKI